MNKILVVEDTIDNRRIIRDLLTRAGFDVIEAADGAAGVALAAQVRPDLILMDIQLSILDGYEATRRIRAIPALAHVPVIAVTSYALSGDEAKARAAGCDAYVAKPFSPRELLARVREYLPRETAAMRDPALILVVDDNVDNRAILVARLNRMHYALLTADDGDQALALARAHRPDLILLDVMMPKMDGFEVCRRLRADTSLPFMPIVILTSRATPEDVVEGLEAGAHDYLIKPVEHAALVARVRAMLRIKSLHDQVEGQAAELARWGKTREARVAVQVAEIERIGRLRRFLPPQVADAIARGDERILEGHRSDIAVVYGDMRGFTAFAEQAEPEDVVRLMREYHGAMGHIVHEYQGTIERFLGDGFLVLFNDPLPCENPGQCAVRMAVAMRARMERLIEHWRQDGFDLGFSIGIARGFATLGRIGFDGRYEYSAVGSVANLGARLCTEAKAGQIIVSERVANEIEPIAETSALGELAIKGFVRPVRAHNVVRLRS